MWATVPKLAAAAPCRVRGVRQPDLTARSHTPAYKPYRGWNDRPAPDVTVARRRVVGGRVGRECPRQEILAHVAVSDHPQGTYIRRNRDCLGTVDAERTRPQPDRRVTGQRHPFRPRHDAAERGRGRFHRPLVFVPQLAPQTAFVLGAEVDPAEVAEDAHRLAAGLLRVLQLDIHRYFAAVGTQDALAQHQPPADGVPAVVGDWLRLVARGDHLGRVGRLT